MDELWHLKVITGRLCFILLASVLKSVQVGLSNRFALSQVFRVNYHINQDLILCVILVSFQF